ncbi:MAG TPA: hypothetical protein VGO47_11630 [Chlamydiales bacterium]|nr:hypothetical protein [Chlamydiales bacterium]
MFRARRLLALRREKLLWPVHPSLQTLVPRPTSTVPPTVVLARAVIPPHATHIPPAAATPAAPLALALSPGPAPTATVAPVPVPVLDCKAAARLLMRDDYSRMFYFFHISSMLMKFILV